MENYEFAKIFFATTIIEKDGKILIAQRAKKDACSRKMTHWSQHDLRLHRSAPSH
jgi:hypothetical protein